MNLLTVVPSMPMGNNAFVGGSVNGMIGLLEALSSLISTKIVLTGARYSEVDTLKKLRPTWADGIAPVPISRNWGTTMSTLELMARIPLECKYLSKRYQIDIVHGHSGYAQHCVVTLACALALRTPAIHTVYCPIAKNVNDKRSWLLTPQVVSIILKRLDRIIAISHNVAKSLSAIGIADEKIKVIPPTIETRRFDARLYNGVSWRERSGISATTSVILFGGNNTTRAKGLDVFLEAMPLIAEHYSDVVFVLVLFKNEKALEIERKLERWGLKNKVRQFGIVDNMPEIMAASDILLAPFSSTDGPADYPLMILEAMAMGKAVVTTPVGGIPEVVEHGKNGMLVNSGHPNDMAKTVLTLLNSKKILSNLGSLAAHTVRKRFSPQNVARQIMQVYEVVISNSGIS